MKHHTIGPLICTIHTNHNEITVWLSANEEVVIKPRAYHQNRIII